MAGGTQMAAVNGRKVVEEIAEGVHERQREATVS